MSLPTREHSSTAVATRPSRGGTGSSNSSGSRECRQVYRSNAPRTFPCPDCGTRGRRVRKRVLEVIDLELHHRVKIVGTVGVYKSKCECCKYFTSEIREASKGTEYSNRVRDEVVRLVSKEGLTYEMVRERLRDDYLITVSIGTIHNWLKERGASPARPATGKRSTSSRQEKGGRRRGAKQAQRVAS
jgi:hypothetical protein